MKATEYFERYNSDPSNESLSRVVYDMIMEIKTLTEQRHAKTNSAMFAILDEIDGKWRAFARLCGESINPKGLELIIEIKFPEMSFFWKDYKDKIKIRR